MTIKILTLLFFTSLMNLASAAEATSSARTAQIPSLNMSERVETLEDFTAKITEGFYV